MKLNEFRIGTLVIFNDICYLYLGLKDNKSMSTAKGYFYSIHCIERDSSDNMLFKDIQLNYIYQKLNAFLEHTLDKNCLITLDLVYYKHMTKLGSIDEEKVKVWYIKNRCLSNLPVIDFSLNVNNISTIIVKTDTVRERIETYKQMLLVYSVTKNVSIFKPLYVKEFKEYHIYTYPISGTKVISLPNNRFINIPSTYHYDATRDHVLVILNSILKYYPKRKIYSRKVLLIDIDDDDKTKMDISSYVNIVNSIQKICKRRNIEPII